MGLELDNPQEFLNQAVAAIQEYQEVTGNLSKQRELEKQTGKAVDSLKKETKEKIDRTLKSRSDEIAATYDTQLKQLDTKLKKAQQTREKAKSQGVKGRIQTDTEAFRIENQELKRQMTAVLKQKHAPGFCSTNLFYLLYHPGSLPEILGLVCLFLLCFLAVPLGIYYLCLPEKTVLFLVLIYLLDILLFGGGYVLLGNLTNGKHREAVQQCCDIRRRMRRNRKSIRSITQGIKKDGNEDSYHLEEYDDEIARIRQERDDIIAKKQSAQNTFDNVTRNIITDEIETGAKPRLDELLQKLSEVSEYRGALETREKYLSLQLSKEYEQYLGKKHMNEADIDRIRTMLTEQQATSVIDAVAKLDHPEEVKAV